MLLNIYIPGLFHSFLFPQNKAINVQVDASEFALLIEVFKLPFEKLDIRMAGRLSSAV